MKWRKRTAILLFAVAIPSGQSVAQTHQQHFLLPPPGSCTVCIRASPIMSTHACNVRFYPSKPVNVCTLGDITIDFKVTAEGLVTDATVTNSSGNDELDSLWANCISRWRYIPAVADSKRVEVPGRTVIKLKMAACGR